MVLKQLTVHIIGVQPCVTYADPTAQWWIQDNNYVGSATDKFVVTSASTDVKKAVIGPLSPALAWDCVSRWFHSAYTHSTKCAKNALPPEIHLRSTRGSADLAYLLSQIQIPKQVTLLTPETASTVTSFHGGIRLVPPLNHPLVIPWRLRSWQQSWVQGLTRWLQLHWLKICKSHFYCHLGCTQPGPMQYKLSLPLKFLEPQMLSTSKDMLFLKLCCPAA